MTIRTRICFIILLFTPLLVYWQSAFLEFGVRDDYSSMREAREEPGKLVRFTASHGRPLYGALLETSYTKLNEVETLWVLRFASILLLTILSLALWRQLYHSGWSEIEAAVIGLGITLLPGAQVLTSWAFAWPHAVALLLSLAGFAAVETELERGGLKRVIALFGGGMIYGLAAVIYQSNALFTVVPLAAILLVRVTRGSSSDFRWSFIHFSTLFAGLMTAYLLVGALFANGVFHASARMQLETNPFTKLIWFFSNPLPNALGLFALRDDFNTGQGIFWAVVVVVLAIIFWGCKAEIARGGTIAKRRVLFCALVLPFLAHIVSLAAAERATGYRIQFALSGLALVLLVFAIRSLLVSGIINQKIHHVTLILIAGVAAFTAHSNAYNLIAKPQSYEWETIRPPAMRAPFPKTAKVYIVTPDVENRATKRIFADEFGSISSNSDWVPAEMFKAVMHERYPTKLPKGTDYTVTSGHDVPADGLYDLVIDLRSYKDRADQ